MKSLISRGRILNAILIVVIIAALPGAIHRLIQTGDPYLFTRRFFEDLLARFHGPGRLRFIAQPAAAILLGARDGVKDSRAGAMPFLWALAFRGKDRQQLLRSAFASTRDIVTIAILLDIISQVLIFREIRPAAALVLGPVLIGTPYAVSRALVNRLWRGRVQPGKLHATHDSRPAPSE